MEEDDAFIIPTTPSSSPLDSLTISELLELQSNLESNVRHEVDDVQQGREESAFGKARVYDDDGIEQDTTEFQQNDTWKRLRAGCGSLPRVGADESEREEIEDQLINFRAVMDGLNKEEEYYQLVKCYYTYLNLQVRLAASWGRLSNFTDTLEPEETDP